MLILDQNNAIIGWQDNFGQNILFPKQELGGKIRGGAHACAPVFGIIPYGQSKWGNSKLPRHGLFRLDKAESSFSLENLVGGGCSRTKFYDPTEEYPYSFMVEEVFKDFSSEGLVRLDYSLKVKRDHGCEADESMPVSLGWHPYFATHGEEFGVYLNNRPQIRETDQTNPAAEFDYFDQRVILETKKHTFKFEFYGTSNIVVWSDDKSRYICIEATSGTDSPHQLMPGNSTYIGIRILQLR